MPRVGGAISCYVRSILKHPDAQVVSIQISHKDYFLPLALILYVVTNGGSRYLVAAFHSEGTLLLLLN
jgi:hypothetical protein